MSKTLAGVIVALVATLSVVTPSFARDLTFEQRVAAQTAIEQVYWSHRIWPAENPGPKPPLSAVMSDLAIRVKVEDYLRKSSALATIWQRPITAAQLQAEMDHMAAHTRDAKVLQEIYDALGNDPFLIAETLARQTLADRTVTEVTASGSNVAFDAWRKEERASTIGVLAPVDGQYTLAPLATSSACESWAATTTTGAPEAGRAFSTGVWTGSEMIVWGEWNGSTFVNTGGRYNPSTDSWVATTTTSAPSGRGNFTSVWTGIEMIVWGGFSFVSDAVNTGGRYNPSTDTWVATTTSSAPSARLDHGAVWTGSEMIVWGGSDFPGGGAVNTGGRYDPSSDSWVATTTTGAPEARWAHVAAWTGSEMIVWGGANSSNQLNTGGRYNPYTDSWMATTTTGAPSARSGHRAVWTGSEMIVWGGQLTNTGGRYNPYTDSWAATTASGAPEARYNHTAVWTGSEMIIWGGFNGSTPFNTGGRYNPSTDSWVATTTSGAPEARQLHGAAWTGSEMIVWGGQKNDFSTVFNTGGRYVPGAACAVGGSITGVTTRQVSCRNRTTGQFLKEGTGDTSWDCEAMGLVVNPGDKLQTGALGIVDETDAHVGGTVTGMSPVSVTCQNLVTGAKVQMQTSATSWDCEAMGLVVSPGDKVQTGASGTAD